MAQTDFNDVHAQLGFEELVRQLSSEPADAWALAEEAWPDPKPIPHLAVLAPPFLPAHLPKSIRAFAVNVSERLSVPLDFPAVITVALLASLLRKKVVIRPKKNDEWTVHINLWAAVVGRPGAKKTPALNECVHFINAIEKRHAANHVELMNVWEGQKKTIQHRINKMKQRLKVIVKEKSEETGNLTNTPEENELLLKIDDLEKSIELLKPKRRRLLTNDATIEKMGELLADNPDGLLYLRDELAGFFATFNKQGHETDREFLLEAWACTADLTTDRIGRGTVSVKGAAVTVAGTIQPGKIQQQIEDAVGGRMGDDGLFQRFQLLVYPEHQKSAHVDVKTDLVARDFVKRAFDHFDQFGPAKHGIEVQNTTNFPALSFSKTAQKRFDEWAHKHEAEIDRHEDRPHFEAHLSKYRSLIPALSVVFQLVDDFADEKTGDKVQLPSLELAIKWGELLSQHAKKAYAIVDNRDGISAHKLLKKIHEGLVISGTPLREVYRKGWSGLESVEKVERATAYLEELSMLKVIAAKGEKGASSRIILINPKTVTDKNDKGAAQ